MQATSPWHLSALVADRQAEVIDQLAEKQEVLVRGKLNRAHSYRF